MVRGFKFRIYEVEELCYPCSENKGADQLSGYRAADLRLYFRMIQKVGFLTTRLIWALTKPVFRVFDQVPHKPGCTATEDGWRLENVEEKLYYPYSENKGADQLRGYREADLRLCFRICKKPLFSRCGSYYTLLNGFLIQTNCEKVLSCLRNVKNSFLVPVVAYIELVIRSTKCFFPDTLMSFFKRLIAKNRYLIFYKSFKLYFSTYWPPYFSSGTTSLFTFFDRWPHGLHNFAHGFCKMIHGVIQE